MRLLALLAATASLLPAQHFSQRGFLETQGYGFFQTAPNDSGLAVNQNLLRWEPSWRIAPWLKLQSSFDARFDTHQQVEREFRLDFEDRRLRRPALSARRLSAIFNRGSWTVEAGRQFIRWGKADILNPTDRFAPKDFLAVVDSDFLAVPAVRATWEKDQNTIDLVWQVRFTPSRTPLINQRWIVFPPELLPEVSIRNAPSRFPGGPMLGARWNHIGAGYEFSLSFYEGFNHLPQIQPELAALQPLTVALRRSYPQLRQYGADSAVPLKWFTVKGEAGWYTTTTPKVDEFLLYVLQLERLVGEWTFVGGYAGEVVTQAALEEQGFAPDRGSARAFLGRVSYTLGPTRSVAVEGIVRQDGQGSLLRSEFSQTYGQHWRATAGFAWIRGSAPDFLGQFNRNSHVFLRIRYSF
jgi:hypothetical protein